MPNTSKCMNKFVKKIPQNKKEQVFSGRSAGLQGWKWIALIFEQDVQKQERIARNQSCRHSGEIFEPFVTHFPFQLNFFDFSTFSIFFIYCKSIKRTFYKLQAILIKYDISGVTVSLLTTPFDLQSAGAPPSPPQAPDSQAKA